MSILNFVNQDQLDELDEDPATAFMQLVNHAQRSLREQTAHLDENERDQWQEAHDLRLSFMNVVLASAKQLEIEPFFSMQVPSRKEFGDRDYDQFKDDLDHYITQLVLGNSLRSRGDTVEILPKSKEAIRTYIHHLRECIETANMGDKKREALIQKLAALEAELEKRRVNMVTVAKIAFAIWAVPGSVWSSYDVTNKLLSSLMHNVAEAKEAEDQQKKLPNPQSSIALSPPRPKPASLFDESDLADDIPF